MAAMMDYPKPWPLFWAAAALALTFAAVSLASLWRGWARGARPAPTPPSDRLAVLRSWSGGVLVQRQLRRLSTLRWAAHLCIFWGFLALCALSALHVVLGLLEAAVPGTRVAAWLLRGEGRPLLKAWGNGFGLVLLAGLLLALARRFAPRAQRAADAEETDTPLVLLLLSLTLTGFLLEYLRGLASADAGVASALRPWLTALWTLHGIGGLALVAWLPRSTLLHALLAPLVIAHDARAEHARKDSRWPGTTRPAATGSPKA